MTCTCEDPREHTDPRRAGWCANCLRQFDSAWLSTDATLTEFLDRLEEASFPGAPPEVFKTYRRHCESRENAGRDSFGLEYLTRENCHEAQEECVDLGIYMHLDLLQARREGDEEEWAIAMSAAYHAFRAYAFAAELSAKRHGSP